MNSKHYVSLVLETHPVLRCIKEIGSIVVCLDNNYP